MRKSLIIGLGVLLVLAVGAGLVFASDSSPAKEPETSPFFEATLQQAVNELDGQARAPAAGLPRQAESPGHRPRVPGDLPRRSGLRHWLAGSSQTKAESCSSSTDRSFALHCFPPRLAATQLWFTTRLTRTRGADLHRSDDVRLRAH